MSGIHDMPTIAELEEAAIRRALALTDTREAAAEALGISKRTLYRRLKQYRIEEGDGALGMAGGGRGPGLLEYLSEDWA